MSFLDKFKDYNVEIHGVRIPPFEISQQYKEEAGVEQDCSNYEFLTAIAKKSLKDKGLTSDKYVNRLTSELEMIEELSFVDYLLLVWDIVNYCHRVNIPVGPGRGSAAGSLILFLIGVTKIDSIKYELYFERFISRARAKKQVIDGQIYLDGNLMCDIDIDICYYKRQDLIRYIEKKFENKTAKISTFNTLSGKLLIKECGKIVGNKTETEMNEISALIPRIFGKVRDIEICYKGERNEDIPEEDINNKKYWKIEPDKKFVAWVDENRQVYDIAIKLRGLVKNKGVHPSALAVSYGFINEECPLELSSDGENTITTYDMDQVLLSCVKLDLLGLRSVSVIDDCCNHIGIKYEDIDINDPIIYQSLQDLRTPHGIFQLEAETGFRTTRKVKPNNIQDLSALLAIARPGALQFADPYSKFTETGSPQSIHEALDHLLVESGGMVLYQEQLMKIGNEIFGLTLEQSENLRRGVGKKKKEVINEFEKILKENTEKLGLDEELYNIYWKVLKDSADYSFNKSHSISYAVLSAITVYLKFKHTQDFYLSLLKMSKFEGNTIQEISTIQREMHHFNIELLEPDIIESDINFKKEGKDIRFGLGALKGISDKSIENLNGFKSQYSNKFEIFEAAKEAGLSIGILTSLIQAGTFNGCKLPESRTKTVFDAQLWNVMTDREKVLLKELSIGKETDDEKYHLGNLIKELVATVDPKSKKEYCFIKESRYGTIRKKAEKFLEIYNQNKNYKEYAYWHYETLICGYSPKYNLKDIFIKSLDSLENINEILSVPYFEDTKMRQPVRFVAILNEIYASKSKKGKKYCKFSIYDETGNLTALMFGGEDRNGVDKLESCKAMNGGKLPKEGSVIFVEGIRKGDDTIFVDKVVEQSNKVYTKLSDIKREKRLDKKEENDIIDNENE
tara:strand:- start:3338 stop:6061 length:2724 start_codon:yes stop_codon:yes gene_type:complete